MTSTIISLPPENGSLFQWPLVFGPFSDCPLLELLYQPIKYIVAVKKMYPFPLLFVLFVHCKLEQERIANVNQHSLFRYV